jgi:hypothetical protein
VPDVGADVGVAAVPAAVPDVDEDADATHGMAAATAATARELQ